MTSQNPATPMTISADDGRTFDAYVATPAGEGPFPAIIVIQEIFGITDELKAKCDNWAKEGYMAVCPDLFWRQQPGIVLDPKDPEQMQHGFQLLQNLNIDYAVDDLKSVLMTLRSSHLCNGKVGTVGYCLGGRLAYLMGTRSKADANIGYYGVTIESYLNESNSISHPLMLHIAEEDKFCSKEAQAEIKRGLQLNPHVTIHSYAGADHAFSRVGGDHYDKVAADLANQRSRDFFAKNLKYQAVSAVA